MQMTQWRKASWTSAARRRRRPMNGLKNKPTRSAQRDDACEASRGQLWILRATRTCRTRLAFPVDQGKQKQYHWHLRSHFCLENQRMKKSRPHLQLMQLGKDHNIPRTLLRKRRLTEHDPEPQKDVWYQRKNEEVQYARSTRSWIRIVSGWRSDVKSFVSNEWRTLQ
ncbi:hypothetical protein N9L68_04030 [bacterium]|nr:hypothetical protein [bacterium]